MDLFVLDEIDRNDQIEEYDTKARIDRLKNDIELINRWSFQLAAKHVNNWEFKNQTYPRNCSRAFWKLCEVLVHFWWPIPADIRATFLAEAPGGFVEAAQFMAESQSARLQYRAISLRSDTKLNDQLLKNVDRTSIVYGPMNGDLTFPETVQFLSNEIDEMTDKYRCNLVTADGGFDVSDDFNAQEAKSVPLILGEVAAALGCQSYEPSGIFVLKVFDLFSIEMTKILWVLQQAYTTVTITKPRTSRPCNSEKYVVAQGLRRGVSVYLRHCLDGMRALKSNQPLWPDMVIPVKFETNVRRIVNAFANAQFDYLHKAVLLAPTLLHKRPDCVNTNQGDNFLHFLVSVMETHVRD